MGRRYITFLFALYLPGSAGAQRVPPVDEAAREPTLVAFRDQLLASIASRDTVAVLAAFAPDVQLDFGGSSGVELLRERLHEPRLWWELQDVLGHGGRFTDDSTFFAPYWFHAELDDPFTQWIVIGQSVRVRTRPDEGSAIVASLSHQIVSEDPKASDAGEHWVAIKVADGGPGYVAARYVRRSVGYRIGMSRQAGRWRIVSFIAGD
jgi:hypothetical protein